MNTNVYLEESDGRLILHKEIYLEFIPDHIIYDGEVYTHQDSWKYKMHNARYISSGSCLTIPKD